MKHNVGDRVRVHSREWFEKNCRKDKNGDYVLKGEIVSCIAPVQELCGTTVTINEIGSAFYGIEKNQWIFSDWMIDEDEMKEETNWEHYQQKIGEFVKTKECTDCPAYKSCDAYKMESCGSTFANWAMCKYVPEEPKPVYRAWTKDTFPLKPGDIIKEKDSDFLEIISATRKSTAHVWIGCATCAIGFDDLFILYTMADGTPCGELISGGQNE